MDPISAGTLATISLGSTALSAGVGVIGALSNAAAQRKQAEYQAQVARNNALIAEQNARAATATGEAAAQAQSFRSRAAGAAIESGQGASGIDIGSPSLTDVRQSQASTGRLDVENVMQRARLQAYGFGTQATGYQAQAGLYDMAGSQAQTAGTIGAFGSLLSGASSFSDKWARFQTSGAI